MPTTSTRWNGFDACHARVRPRTRALGALLGPLLLLAPAGCAPTSDSPADGSGGATVAPSGQGSGGSTTSTGGAPGSGGAFAGTGGAFTGSGGASLLPGTGGASPAGSGGSTDGSGSGGAVVATGGASNPQGGRSGGAGGKVGGGGGSGVATGTGGATGPVGGATSPGCAGKTYKLCEDFETGASGAIPTGWTTFKGYGASKPTDVGLATDEFHSGTMALKSNSASSGQARIQKSLSTLGATASKHWGRIFYKVQTPAAKNASGVLHVTWVGLNGATTENRVVDIVEASNGTHQWLFNNPNDKGSLGSAYSWSFDTAWHCAEWFVDVTAKSYKFFTDGAEVPSIEFTGKADSQMSDYTAVIVGATFYQMPNAAFVMWFDDLAIDDTQIGCK